MTVNMKNWQELKKPTALEIKSTSDGKRKATFVAEPLERGFGLTLGNALRRVLLSSLQGAAVTSIRIENVLHEFSSLAGVREDVTDIVLNIKQVALRMEGEGPKRLQLSATGPAEVKAGDIAVSGDIEVMRHRTVSAIGPIARRDRTVAPVGRRRGSGQDLGGTRRRGLDLRLRLGPWAPFRLGLNGGTNAGAEDQKRKRRRGTEWQDTHGRHHARRQRGAQGAGAPPSFPDSMAAGPHGMAHY